MGGNVFPVLFAILMGAFGVDRSLLSLALPAYMIPYAVVQLVSGGISDLTSRHKSIVLGFGSYGAATLLAGLSPNIEVFLLAQVLQGATNAFTTPLLMATIGDVAPGKQMGRTMGFFSTANLSGMMLAPLIAGFAGDVSWRLAYVIIGLITWGLTAWYIVWFKRYGASVPARPHSANLRADMTQIFRTMGGQIILLATLAFLANGAMRGAVYLFVEYLHESWDSGVEAAGLILATYGLAGLLVGPFTGYFVDRAGVYRSIAVSMVGVTLTLVLMGLATSPMLFAMANFLLGAASIYAWSALNTLAIRAVPAHRGTAASIFGSSKFLAQGISPIWFTPLYAFGPTSIFYVSAVMALALLLPLAALYARAGHQQDTPASEPVRDWQL